MSRRDRGASRWVLVACLTLGVLAVVLRAAWFGVADRSPDEQLYAGFAHGISQQGPGWFPNMVSLYTNDGDVDYPWVHRAGYLSLVALAQLATRRHDAVAGELLSTLASLAGIALAGLLAWRWAGPLASMLTLLFLAVSPLDLAIARRAWQDTTIAFLTLAMVALALRSLEAARPWRWRWAFLGLSAFTLLVKESALIPFGLGVLVLTWDAWRHRGHVLAPIAVLAGGGLVLVVLAGTLLVLCGGLENARELIRLTPEAWKSDWYIRDYQTGGPGYYLTGLRILQPLPWALGVLAAVVAVLRPRLLAGRDGSAHLATVLRLLGGYVLIFLMVSCAYSSKNMRFLSPLYGPVALLAAALVTRGLTALRSLLPVAAWRTVTAVVTVVLVLSAFSDARRFDHWFNGLQIQDLATPWFTKADAH